MTGVQTCALPIWQAAVEGISGNVASATVQKSAPAIVAQAEAKVKKGARSTKNYFGGR